MTKLNSRASTSSSRTGRAIFRDDHQIPRIEGKVYAIFHARSATDSKKVGSIFSHPYFAAADDRLIWLAHHGELEENVITAPHLVDSEYILKFVMDNGTVEGIKKSKLATQSSLNMCMLEIRRDTLAASLKYMNYYLDKSMGEYYDMHYSRMRGGGAVMSSTLKEYGIKGTTAVTHGTLEELE